MFSRVLNIHGKKSGPIRFAVRTKQWVDDNPPPPLPRLILWHEFLHGGRAAGAKDVLVGLSRRDLLSKNTTFGIVMYAFLMQKCSSSSSSEECQF